MPRGEPKKGKRRDNKKKNPDIVYIKPDEDCKSTGCGECCKHAGYMVSPIHEVAEQRTKLIPILDGEGAFIIHLINLLRAGHQVKIAPYAGRPHIISNEDGVCSALERETGRCTLLKDPKTGKWQSHDERKGKFPFTCAIHPFICNPKEREVYISSDCVQLVRPLMKLVKEDAGFREKVAAGRWPEIHIPTDHFKSTPNFSRSLDILKSQPFDYEGTKVGDLLEDTVKVHVVDSHKRELEKMAKRIQKAQKGS